MSEAKTVTGMVVGWQIYRKGWPELSGSWVYRTRREAETAAWHRNTNEQKPRWRGPWTVAAVVIPRVRNVTATKRRKA